VKIVIPAATAHAGMAKIFSHGNYYWKNFFARGGNNEEEIFSVVGFGDGVRFRAFGVRQFGFRLGF
jgi:hypothetical protein